MVGNNVQRVGIFAIAAILVGGLYWLLWSPPTELCKADPEVCPCQKLLPDDRQLGNKFETDDSGELSSVDFGGSSGTGNPVSPELAEKFVQCIERTRSDIKVINFSRIDTSPLGQVAHQWGRRGGLKINLRPPSAEEQNIINNLQIGPDSGMRWQIMERWCKSAMQDCIECGAQSEGEDTVAVEIRLKNGAPLKRKFWSDGWPTGDVVREKWELVDTNGNRYLYSCRPE